MELLNSHNNRISDNKIASLEEGIRLWDSSDNYVEKNQINTSSYGVRLRTANNNDIVYNTFSGNTEAINFWQQGTTNRISNNKIADGNDGLSVIGNNTIDRNILTGNSGIAIKVDSQTTVTNNVVSNNAIGIVVSSGNNILKNNTMTNNEYNLFFPELHSNYWRLDNVQVIVNDIDESNTLDGKTVYYWVNKQDETVPPNAGYIILVNCNNITVQNQNIKSNKEGIILLNTNNSIVFRNTVTENTIGLGIFRSSKNTISENIIKNNTVGIRIGDSKFNTITLNNITLNNEWGIDFKGSQTNNTIYCNNFIDNGGGSILQISIDKLYGRGLGNFWDNGTIGNYWSDYLSRYPNATKIGETSVGNTAFYINENNIDYCPLLETITIPEFPSWTILPALIMTMLVAIMYRKKLRRTRSQQSQ
jgi:parallel beta-helix repeat protein